MNNYSSVLQLQLLPMKTTGVAPKNTSNSLVQTKRVKIFPRADLITSKPTKCLVISSCKGNDQTAELHVQQIFERQSKGLIPSKVTHFDPTLLNKAYKICQNICAEHATSNYLGSLLFTKERQKAIWAVYAWGRRTDDLVDGENANITSSAVLDSWEMRLEDIFDGRPHDLIDTALAHTVQQYPLDIQLFKDLIKGMRMDTWKTRYENYEELKLYSYYVAGTIGLMTVPIAGISPESATSAQSIYEAAFSMAMGSQMTNILRDVVEDASMGRVYLPQDELREFGLTDDDIFKRNVKEEWREFTKKQIVRARYYYDQAERGVHQLDSTSRWPIWTSIMLNRKILDKIEENNYDNLTKRARVGNVEKILTLPLAYARAMRCQIPGTNHELH